jgi:hypothetical protein
MKTIRSILTLLVLGAGLGFAAEARATTVNAILITAGNNGGSTDPRLAPYEATLRRVLRFNHYSFQGSDATRVSEGSRATLIIGQGHELTVEGGANPYSIRIQWTQGGHSLMNTGLTLRPGVPAVLGGPATGDNNEVYAVILIAR